MRTGTRRSALRRPPRRRRWGPHRRRASRRASRRRARSPRARRRPRRDRRAAAPAPCPVCASVTSRAIWASAVSSPTRVARTTSLPPTLIVAPLTSSPGRDLDGHALAGEERLVDGAAAFDDDAVGGDLLARPHHEEIAHAKLLDRDATLAPVRLEQRRLLCAELEQRTQRRPRPSLGARLEVAPGEHEDGDDRGDLEVDVVARGVSRQRRARTASSCPGCRRSRKKSATTDQPYAASVPTLISVSIVAAPWRRFCQAARWNGQPPQRTTGVASCERRAIASSVNWKAGTIASEQDGQREQRRHHEPPPQRRRWIGLLGGRLAAIPRQARGVADLGDGVDEILGPDDGRVVVDRGLLGGVVHRCGHTLELVQPAARSGRAGRAGHPLDRELEPLGGRDRAHRRYVGSRLRRSLPSVGVADTSKGYQSTA